MQCKTRIMLAATMALGPLAVLAQSSPDPLAMEVITISATRTERRIDKVANTATVTTASSIEREGARDLKDVFRNEVDVTVPSGPTRFTAAGSATGRAGNEGINIRGLEGNQVLMLVDGVRVPNSFAFGSFATGRGDYLDVDSIKTAEVLRGPASSQFGSDGLAGAVSFRTLAPQDLLGADKTSAAFVRGSHASVDKSFARTLGLAGKSGAWQTLLLGSYRNGHELANRGGNQAQDSRRTAPNPVHYDNRYLLGKVFYAVSSTQQWGLSLESQQRKQDAEVYSARAVPPLTASSTLDLDTHDVIKRERVMLEHHFKDQAAAIQRLDTRLMWQDATVSQFASEDRNTSLDRTRDNRYRTRVSGFSTQAQSQFGGTQGGVSQRVSGGLDWSQADISGVRDGTVPPFGETFPAKPFPDTRYTLGGAFLQNEVELGSVSLIPALRFDQYRLSPDATGYPGKPAALSDHAWTPRLGVVWQVAPGFAPFAQWSRGFRAPTPDQVNNGFTNLASGYTSIGNPDLNAEHADSVELGLRGKLAGVRYSLAAYDNHYRDFISQQVVSGAGTPANPLVFQYINLTKAHIRGWEGRLEWQIDGRWRINAGLAQARGDSESQGVASPLDSVMPLKAVLGVRQEVGNWGWRANWVLSQAKDAGRIAAAADKPFAAPGYAVLDLGWHWQATPQLAVFANLNNVFNTRYWRWSDVRGLAASSTVKDAYTAPGRNAQVSVRYDF